MKKFLFLVFPLAFFIGFMPYFMAENNDVRYTSSEPQITRDITKEDSRFENDTNFTYISLNVKDNEDVSGFKPIVKPAKILNKQVYLVVENATKMIDDGIERVVFKSM